jgi:hypothetical protein
MGRDWLKEDGRFIPHPSTWLNDAGWMDDVKPPGPANGRASPFAGVDEFERMMNGNQEPADGREQVFETTGVVR